MAGVLVLIVLCAVLAVVCPAAWQPWSQFAATAVVALALALLHGGRPRIGSRPRPRNAAVDVVDLVAPDRSLVGCVERERVVTTAVEISAGALVATEIGRDSPGVHRGVRLPLAAVARQLDQGGVVLEGIDVVVRGRRAADGPDGSVYSDLVGPLALVSRRRVHLLARFDLTRLAVDAGGGPNASLGPLVAVATERLRRSLVHHGVPCRVLAATELAALFLEAEAVPGPGVGLAVRPGVDPRDVRDALGTVAAAEMTEVLRLRRVAGSADLVDVVSTVGLTRVDADSVPPGVADRCHPLRSAGALPVPGEPLPDELARVVMRWRVTDLDQLAPPVHGVGQIVGATRAGRASALQLAGPHLRSVLLTAPPAVCRQVVFRTVAAGYRVAVVTDVPDRWRPLEMIDDETRYRIVDPAVSDPGAPVDAVVWDVAGPLSEGRIDALAGPGGPDVTPPTVIRVDPDWESVTSSTRSSAPDPDLVLDGRIDGWISVEPRAGESYRVSVVAGPGEDTFIGRRDAAGPATGVTPAGVAPSASPDRR